MNQAAVLDHLVVEKLDATAIALVDNSGHLLWHSVDPDDVYKQKGLHLTQIVPPEYIDEIIGHLSRCILRREIVRYTIRAEALPCFGGMGVVTWRATMWPVPGLQATAAVIQCWPMPEGFESLNEGDIQLLKLLAHDYALKDVAAEMHVSQSAIDSRMRHLKEKLGCENIGGLVALAARANLI